MSGWHGSEERRVRSVQTQKRPWAWMDENEQLAKKITKER